MEIYRYPGYDAGNNGRLSGSYAWIDFSGTDQGTVMELVPINISQSNPQLDFDFSVTIQLTRFLPIYYILKPMMEPIGTL